MRYPVCYIEFDNAFNTFMNSGLFFDFAFITIGVGGGFNFIIQLDSNAPEEHTLGLNMKVHVDLNLVDIKVSAYWLMLLASLFYEDPRDYITYGNIGVSVLFTLR